MHLQKSKTTHVFKDLATGNLLSVGQLCDDEYSINFTKNIVLLSKSGKISSQGKSNHVNGMWYINLPTQSPNCLQQTLSFHIDQSK